MVDTTFACVAISSLPQLVVPLRLRLPVTSSLSRMTGDVSHYKRLRATRDKYHR